MIVNSPTINRHVRAGNAHFVGLCISAGDTYAIFDRTDLQRVDHVFVAEGQPADSEKKAATLRKKYAALAQKGTQ